MGMTMTQKILAEHAHVAEVKAGQLIEVDLDMVLGNDITSPVAIKEFEKYGFEQVFDPGRVTMVMDHFAILKLRSNVKLAVPSHTQRTSNTFMM